MEQTTTGFAHEIEFWKDFVKSDRFLNNWVFPEQNPEIRANHPDVAKCFDDFSEAFKAKNEWHIIDVLDIGSGALPWIKGILPNMRLISCDPLADEYGKIFNYDLHEQSQPIKAFAEELPFADDTFDIVHCSNALDHTQNPRKAIIEMERVCRPGGMILIQGFENEAVHENWQGLHQWNIRIEEMGEGGVKVLQIDGKEGYYFSNTREVVYANTSTVQTGPHTERNWFVFAYKN